MLKDHTAANPPSIKGSVMLATASSSEEVLEKLKGDVYAKEVWDLENVQIIPVSGRFHVPVFGVDEDRQGVEVDSDWRRIWQQFLVHGIPGR